ncbi:MAG: hypothetical protein HYX35_04550 [Proteobacteria bacterium]|nr:hypothetical protein [Pseudomonadota bacterium]
MIKYLAQKIRFKQAILSVCVMGGFATLGWAMDAENQLYQLGDGAVSTPKVKMKTTAPGFESVSDFWVVAPSEFENAYRIVGFPGQKRPNNSIRGHQDYRPSATRSFDTLILTRSHVPSFLDDYWTPNGFSSHVIIAKNGTLFIHADPLNEKGQMAGKWNNRSLEVAFIDEGDKKLSLQQQNSLKKYIDALQKKTEKIHIKYGGSIWDAKQIEKQAGYENGQVANIADVLQTLTLASLSEFFKTPDDISNK